MQLITQGKTNWKFLMILVVLAAIVGGGILWWQKNIPQPEGIMISSQNETAGWQTYTSSKMGFSVSFPSDWSIGEETILSTGVEINIRKNNDVRILIRTGVRYNQDLGRNYYLGEWIEGERDTIISFYGPYYTEKIFEFAGQEATEFIYEDSISSPPYLYREIYTGRNDKVDTIFEIVTDFNSTKDNVYDPIIDQMLSTFRFIEEKERAVDWTEITTNSEFREYFEEIIKTNPGLEEIKKFSKSEATTIRAREVGYPSPPKSKDEPEWVFSPDETKAVSIFAYFGEPDSSLDIYNRKNDGKVERLQDCGTPCGLGIVFWLNNEQFIFVQRLNEYIYSGGSDSYVLNIILYDLAKDTEVSYISQELEEYPVRPSWPEWDDKYYKPVCAKLFGEENCQVAPR